MPNPVDLNVPSTVSQCSYTKQPKLTLITHIETAHNFFVEKFASKSIKDNTPVRGGTRPFTIIGRDPEVCAIPIVKNILSIQSKKAGARKFQKFIYVLIQGSLFLYLKNGHKIPFMIKNSTEKPALVQNTGCL